MRTERYATIRSVVELVAFILMVHVYVLIGVPFTNHHDNLDGATPLRVEAARQWTSGQIPLWNPWKRVGMPLLADTTAGALYPGNVPFLFASTEKPDDLDSASRALDQVAVINAVLGGLFMFVFLRVLALAHPAAVLGGLLFACSGTMEWFAGWYIQIQSSAVWLPLVLASVHAAYGAGMAKWTTIGAATVALQFFAGFPETSFYTGVIAIAYATSLAVSRSSVAPMLGVVAIYSAGLLLSAVQLLPSLELQSLSRRPAELPLDVFQSLPASVAMFRAWALAPAASALEFPPQQAYYFGMVAVVAAVIGAVASFRRSAFFVVLLLVGVVLSLGAATPASELLHRVPGFNAFRHPFKHLFEISFAMPVLAAFGLERLIRRFSPWERPASRQAQAAYIGVAAILLVCVGTLGRNIVAMTTASLEGSELSIGRPSTLKRIEPGWRVLAARQVFQSRDSWRLIGDYPSQFQVHAVNGAGPYLWQPLADRTGMIEEETTFRRGLFAANDRTLSLLSGRYLFQAKYGERMIPAVQPEAWSVVSATLDGQIVERKDALPRIRFVGAARCATDDEVGASLSGSGEDPATVALLDCATQPAPTGPFHEPAALSVTTVTEEAGALILDTNVPDGASAFLVVSQSDFPGWHAAVDGRRALVRRVHGLVQGIELPPGSRRVEMRYMPLAFLVGAALSGSTLVVLLLWCLVSSRWKEPSLDGRYDLVS
jgi:hypothetical protein